MHAIPTSSRDGKVALILSIIINSHSLELGINSSKKYCESGDSRPNKVKLTDRTEIGGLGFSRQGRTRSPFILATPTRYNKMSTADQSSGDSKSKSEDSATASEGAAAPNPAEPKNVQELTNYIQNMLQQMQDRFQTMSDQIISRIDDMGSRIDDLEHNINDLMTQSGQAEQGAIQDQSSK